MRGRIGSMLIPTKATELFKSYVLKDGTVEVYVTDWCKQNINTELAANMIYALTKIFATIIDAKQPSAPPAMVTITDHHPKLECKDKKYFMDGEEVSQEIFRYQMEIVESAKRLAKDSQADGHKN
jgi:hypothetical protein